MGTYYHTLPRGDLPKLPGRVLSFSVSPHVSPDLSMDWCLLHRFRVAGLVCTDYARGKPRKVRQWAVGSQQDLWSLIESLLLNGRVTWLVAHSLSYHWTIGGGWAWIENRGVKLESYAIDDPPTVLWLTAGERHVRAVCLCNYWRKPLPSIAAALGLPYRAADPLADTDQDAADLAIAHAGITSRAVSSMVGMLADAVGGGWNTTAASIAWSVFRARRWGQSVRIHGDDEATRLERASYSGGRAEAYTLGRVPGPVYAVDVNNLYGSVMHRRLYPIRLRGVCKPTPTELRRKLESGLCAVASVRVRVDRSSVPRRVDNEVTYPAGEFDTTLAGPDLAALLQWSRVEKVYQAAIYDGGDPFGDWVGFWYRWRLTARGINDKAGAALCKLITCTLFGRFGMVGKKWSAYPGCPPQGRYRVWHERNPKGEGWIVCRMVAGQAQWRIASGESSHSAVAIASYVTSYGRQEMIKLRSLAGPDNVFYEDTDCLHVNQEGLDRLGVAGCLDPSRLGALKIAASVSEATYFGPKSYTLGTLNVASGLSAEARAVSEGVWVQDRKLGLPRVATSGPTDTVLVKSATFRRQPPDNISRSTP